MKWFVHALKNTFNFSGRARRQEYWMYYLFGIIISFVIIMIEEMLNLKFSPEVGILSTLFGIIFMIPSLSVTVRRLHDIGRSGAWILIIFIPFGAIVLFVFTVLDSQQQTNRWGPSQKPLQSDSSYSV